MSSNRLTTVYMLVRVSKWGIESLYHPYDDEATARRAKEAVEGFDRDDTFRIDEYERCETDLSLPEAAIRPVDRDTEA